MKELELVIGTLMLSVSLLIIGNIIFTSTKAKKITIVTCIILSTLLTTMMNLYNETLISNILRIIILFTTFILFYKIIYKKDMSITIMFSFLTYLIYFASEVIIDIPLYIILTIFDISSELARNMIIVNTLASIISIIITYYCREKIREIINTSNIDRKTIIIISILILLTLSLIIFSTPVRYLRFNADFIIMMILLILFCAIGYILIKQKIETQKITDKYKKLAGYSQNNEGLLEEYRMNLHETKNQLIIIDNMIPKKYKEIHEYIDGLIEKSKSNKYYWITELKYIPSQELKGFMNYKIMEMINNKLNMEVNISRELDKKIIKNYKPKDKEDLYSIIGIFLDNAREASKESKEKAVSVQMYMENKNIKLIIANTYKGKIDLSKIDEYGYSSKGTNRGTGLHIVNGIVNRSKLLEKETTLLENYFVQTLTIKPKQKKKKS